MSVGGEDINHVFRFCSFAKEVWHALQYDVRGQGMDMNFHAWLF